MEFFQRLEAIACVYVSCFQVNGIQREKLRCIAVAVLTDVLIELGIVALTFIPKTYAVECLTQPSEASTEFFATAGRDRIKSIA